MKSTDAVRRFHREVEAAAQLNHPNIVTIHSIEEADGIRFLTMEHVEGETLSKQIPPRGFAMERLLSLAIALADAVSAARDVGLLEPDP